MPAQGDASLLRVRANPDCIGQIIGEAVQSRDLSCLKTGLDAICRSLGFPFYLLASHGPLRTHRWLDLSNLPGGTDGRSAHLHDDLAQLCRARVSGFFWSPTPIARGDRAGLGEACTIPIHGPAGKLASCSFMTGQGTRARRKILPLAQYVATTAYEAACTIHRARAGRTPTPASDIPRLSDRQRECITLAARGKSDTDAAQLLGISSDTVHQHLETAKRRYGVSTRSQLIVRVLFDGQIPFEAMLQR